MIQTAQKLRLTWKGRDRNMLVRMNAVMLAFNNFGKTLIRITQDGEAAARESLRQYGVSRSDDLITQSGECR